MFKIIPKVMLYYMFCMLCGVWNIACVYGSCLWFLSDSPVSAVLSKMQQTKTLSVFMSLITIYAILINHKLTEVVTFLSSLPDPTGRSALEYVLKEWVANQHNFYGMFERQVTCIALSKLLQLVLSSSLPQNDILKTMVVQG